MTTNRRFRPNQEHQVVDYFNTPGFDYDKLGPFLGYPSCCLEAFRELLTLGQFNSKAAPMEIIPPEIVGTGFRPCVKCARTKTGETMIAEIQANRICPIPFPDMHWTQTVLDSFIVYCTKDTE